MMQTRVYPRGCGGTLGENPPGGLREGLSPRVRGNLRRGAQAEASVGSIPAGAGEPSWAWWRRRLARVYPRGCGGTAFARLGIVTGWGLSPRVRGNLDSSRSGSRPVGSIPAGAGEPAGSSPRRRACRVYPRGCGGTSPRCWNGSPQRGLSPRVRGNQLGSVDRGLSHGSIPAGAGEPLGCGVCGASPRVYPRGCGGTLFSSIIPFPLRGLSPRVRGNRLRHVVTGKVIGSIPAGAGEPLDLRRRPMFRRVYPRGCGGTSRLSRARRFGRGLSPRVRGNLWPFWPIRREESRLCHAASWLVSVVKERGPPRDHDLLTSRTPSASQMSFGGSPRWRSAKPPAAVPSRQIMATAPLPRVVNQSSTTAHTRSRTPAERSGDTYTPGATSSIADARNPRYLASTSRVTTTVMGMVL